MADNLIYGNAPLIEVMAELRWNLVPLASIPGAAIDPHFASLAEAFISACAKDYPVVERLAPPEMPQEMLAGRPVIRLRPGQNQWPLFQVGPGLFTCNAVPPYRGWAEFKPLISEGLKRLLGSFPVPKEYVRFEGIELRYINGFTQQHGLGDVAKFVKEDLGLSITFPEDKLAKFGANVGMAELAFETKFELATLKGASLGFKIAPGFKDNVKALLTELRVTSPSVPKIEEGGEIEAWLEVAHEIIRGAFQTFTSERLQKLMGAQTGATK